MTETKPLAAILSADVSTRNAMPQLWLTYQEMADEFGCEPVEARDAAAARAWTRKHSHDGKTRVLMPSDLMQAYFVAKATQPLPAPQHVVPALEQLRRVLARAPSAAVR